MSHQALNTSIAMTVLRDGVIYLSAIQESYSPGDMAIYAEMLTPDFMRADDIPCTHWLSEFPAISMTYFQDDTGGRGGIALDEDGYVYFIATGATELIPDAGLWNDGAADYGYVQSIRQIGQHLYVCGGSGQVYQRRGENDWVHVDQGLLQTDPDVEPRIMLSAIHGPHERAIYAAGYLDSEGLPPVLMFFNGHAWRRVSLPDSAERLVEIHVENAGRIWLCGANGTLLLGNAEQGFVSVSQPTDNQLFYNMAQHQGRLYLASNLGLFVYDPQRPSQGIAPVHTGLTPEPADVVAVGCDQQVLWVLGSQDLLRFDGQRWERLAQPHLNATLTPPAQADGPPAYAPKDDSTLAEALTRRVCRFGIAGFLRTLAQQLGQPEDTFTPAMPQMRLHVPLPTHGLSLTLSHPHADCGNDTGDPSRWSLDLVQFYLHDPKHGHFAGPLPAGLDPENETPASAEAKLGVEGHYMSKKNIRQGDYREAYYLPDFLAMGITWKMQPNNTLRGISHVSIARLGSAHPFFDPNARKAQDVVS